MTQRWIRLGFRWSLGWLGLLQVRWFRCDLVGTSREIVVSRAWVCICWLGVAFQVVWMLVSRSWVVRAIVAGTLGQVVKMARSTSYVQSLPRTGSSHGTLQAAGPLCWAHVTMKARRATDKISVREAYVFTARAHCLGGLIAVRTPCIYIS